MNEYVYSENNNRKKLTASRDEYLGVPASGHLLLLRWPLCPGPQSISQINQSVKIYIAPLQDTYSEARYLLSQVIDKQESVTYPALF